MRCVYDGRTMNTHRRLAWGHTDEQTTNLPTFAHCDLVVTTMCYKRGSRGTGNGERDRDDVFSFSALPSNGSFSTLHLTAMEKQRQSLLGGNILFRKGAWVSLAGLIWVSLGALQQVSSSALPCFALDTFIILKKDLVTFSYNSHISFPHFQNQRSHAKQFYKTIVSIIFRHKT